ncbi:MAG: dTDP-4-dehydrorhamnose 3,5-epimerase [Nanoarchaeota archaeon]|nr:dTDP-4-dehydrorhamnose 3,5-epimerase [Nanoarchaeota archaeon]
MKITKTEFEGLLIIEPDIFNDDRGCFFDIYDKKEFKKIGIDVDFVQDSQTISKKDVIRGLHFQKPPFTRDKILYVSKGAVLDVVVDLRKNSPTYGKWFSTELTEENKKMLLVPKGFAHGYLVLENNTTLQYQFSNFYNKESQSGMIWNDPDVNIDWQLGKYGIRGDELIISEKDKNNPKFKEIEPL